MRQKSIQRNNKNVSYHWREDGKIGNGRKMALFICYVKKKKKKVAKTGNLFPPFTCQKDKEGRITLDDPPNDVRSGPIICDF